MENEPKRRADRYDTSGDVEAQYLDEAQTVLVNKKGIADLQTLQVEEEEALARAYESLLGEVRVDTPIFSSISTDAFSASCTSGPGDGEPSGFASRA